MEIEKIKKVTENYDRIKDLRWFVKQVYKSHENGVLLTFANYNPENPRPILRQTRSIIEDILDKHQKEVYSEIATEIRRLEKEMEDL